MQKFLIIITSVLFFSVTNLFSQNKYTQYGLASFYADKFEGHITANGEKYSHSKLTAAHLNFPFNTRVKVTNLSNNKSVIVRINDRGPFGKDRIIDLSKSAAKKLNFIKSGITQVKVEIVDFPKEDINKNVDKKSSNNNYKPYINNNKEIYEFNSSKANPNGFGVQIASYKELSNLMRICDSLKNVYNKKIYVQVSNINDNKLYRVILGNFSDTKKAETFKSSIQNKYPGCFIVDFRNK
ncbi:MAG: septal ring lytic transglycosylase RlpA family lipoprotein [Bacteroidetes bacterium]|nr:MAG: septal ring lytic transglycosylase RlpA family lipoprotein [Bacteroidota bacterium]